MKTLGALVLAALGLATALEAGQIPAPTLVVDSPTADTRLSGLVRFVARVAPAAARVREIAFYVDGQVACRISSGDTCEWDAGRARGTASVRVVAELVDGRRLIQTVRVNPSAPAGTLFSSTVDAVVVPVQVIDQRGRPVGGLKAEQFRVLEDGMPQEILSFNNEETAAQVLLILDISGSMSPVLPDLKDTVRTFVRTLRPQDVLALAGLNQGLALFSPPTTERALTRAAVDRLRAAGGTAFYDGLIRAATLMRRWPRPRTVVAFTDGEDVHSLSSVDAARMALQKNDIVLFLVAQGKAFEDAALQKRLSALAVETGGAAWFAKNMTSLSGHFADVASRMSGQYTLSYVSERPPGDGQWRRVDVEVRGIGRNVAVHARAGYLAVRAEEPNP